MDSGEIVTQQPVSTLPDLMNDIPNSRGGPPAVVGEATLPFPAEPVPKSSKLELAPALGEQTLAVRETPAAVPSQDDRTDDGGESVNVEKAVVGSSILADAAVVQQIKETVDIEVDIPAPAADAASGPHEGTVLLVSNITREAGGHHVGHLIEQSNADGIAVEVVLNEARPAISDAQLLPLREDGSGLVEIPTNTEVGIVGAFSNVVENGGSQLSVQIGNAGYSVEVEATVDADAPTAVNSSAISLFGELDEAGPAAAVTEELDVSIRIAELEAEQVEEVVMSAAGGGDVATVERISAAVLLVKDGNSIEEPEFPDYLDGKVADPAADNSIKLRFGDASPAVTTAERKVLPAAESEGAPLDSADAFTADVSTFSAPELESLEAMKTFDPIVDVPKIADEELNVSNSSFTNTVGSSAVDGKTAPELNDLHPSEDAKADVRVYSGQDGKIVVELNSSVSPEERMRLEVLSELRTLPVLLDTAGDALNARGPVTSKEMNIISKEKSSIFVQLDASCVAITSENLEAVDLPERVDGTIRASDDSFAGQPALDHSEDASTEAIGVAETIEELVAIVSAPKDVEMADVRQTSAEEPSIEGELDPISHITSIPALDDLKEENPGRADNKTREEVPAEERASLTDVPAIFETHPATEKQRERINSEQMRTSEKSSVHSVETIISQIPGSSDDANGEEIQATLCKNEMETSPLETPLNKETAAETFDKIQHTALPDVPPESTVKTETATETLILTPAYKIQGNAALESVERTEELPVTFALQELSTNVEEDGGPQWEETVDNVINAAETVAVVKEDDTEMVNAPPIEEDVEGQEAFTITEPIVPEEGHSMDDQITPPVGLVAIEETIASATTIRDDTTTTTTTGEEAAATAEDVDGQGVLIGVGSSVESSGLTITEIAETAVVVEGFQAERQSSWALTEPLITPPEEEIIEAIGDLIDDSILDTEPVTADGAVLVVADDLQTVFVKGVPAESETAGITQNPQTTQKDVVLDDTEQPDKNPNDTLLVATGDEAEPLDLQDGHSFILAGTAPAAADTAILLASPPVNSPPESKQAADVGAETDLENVAQLQENVVPASAEVRTVVVCAEEDFASVSREENLEARDIEVAVGADRCPASETGPVSISMSSRDAEKPSSIDETAKDLIPEVPTVDEANNNNIAEGPSELVVPSSVKLGPGLEAVVDGIVLSTEAKAVVSAEAGVVVPAESDMERSEKKRGREEEDGAVAEDEEKTTKAAKTSATREISVLDAAEANNDVKIEEEDVQVDKKRPRDEAETVTAMPDVSLQTKAQKTGSAAAADAPSEVRKGDTEEEADADADAEESVDMDEKEEEAQEEEKSANGAAQPKYKKRKIALFLGYSGAGYQGMQKNPGAITIEGELEEALFRAGAIAESNYGQPQKLDWRRAARTDKGVSAVGQVVSGCFFIDPPGFIDRVNSHLPKQIRVYGYKRATAGFNSKKLCDRRKYEYVLPVYAFDPSVHLDRETAQARAAAEKFQSVSETETVTTTVTKIFAAPAAETEACVISDSEMKESAGTEDEGRATVMPENEGKEESRTCSYGMCAIAEEVNVITEIAIQENGAAGGPVQAQEQGLIEQKDVVMVTEFAVENVEESVPVQAQEALLEGSEATLADGASLEVVKEDLDGKASTTAAPEEVLLVQRVQEVVTERREEVIVTEAVADTMSIEEKKEALDEKVKTSTYKFGDAEFNRLNKILGGFEGHHNFHNFTARTKATDPSANRYIISFGVENTFNIDGIEFVRCSVVGQSFMLHQIRKMIGLAVAIMRGTAPESILATALRRDAKINVPMAPELGLFLEECYYSAYNRKFHTTHEDMSLSSFADEVKEFKDEFIYPHIVSTEARNSTFAMWLHSLNDRHYPDFVTAREAEALGKTE